MVGVVKTDAQNKRKPGRRPKLIIEDQVLMVIQYWREYRTYYHIGLDWGLSESAVCWTGYKIENILIKSRKFRACGQNGGVKGMAKQLGLEEIEVISPSGRQTITLK